MKPENISYQLYNRAVCTKKLSQMSCPQWPNAMAFCPKLIFPHSPCNSPHGWALAHLLLPQDDLISESASI